MLKRLIIAVPLAFVGALWFYYLVLPWPIRLRAHDPQRTALIERRSAQARSAGETLEIRQQWVPLERISGHLRRAVIVAEDGRFYEHGGVDWLALREELRYSGGPEFSILDPADLRALFDSFQYYRANRERIRGRSTITQQVAKNLYFRTERSPLRKLEELIVARRLERFLTKDRILEIYLNIAELGPGIFGAEAAARHYFGRSAAELSREQAAALAATLPHPLTSNPRTRPARMAWRQNLILQRMGGTGPVETVPLEPSPPPAAEPLGEPAEPADTVELAPREPPPMPPRDTMPRDTMPRDTMPRDTIREDTP
jgi:monofunctional glycosyltransferase